ncbi:MAG: hypothetical protein ACKV22_30875 [Bryobacteraceae bacterium]
MKAKLPEALARIADSLDPPHLAEARKLQEDAWRHRPLERIPFLLLGAQPPEWPLYPYHETLDDPEKMLWNELQQVYVGSVLKDDRMLAIRAHFGPGVVASLLGARLIVIDDETPWVEPLRSSESIRAVVAQGVPDMDFGWGRRVLRTEAFYRQVLDDSPPLGHHVRVFVSDTQGPFDTAHLLWGEEIYLAIHDEPDLVHALLDLITRTTIAFTQRQKELIGEPGQTAVHFGYSVPGGVRVVDDVAVNLSARLYAEFCRPYNQRVFEAFRGGYMHYCGDRLHSHGLRLETDGLRGIEMGFDNPRRNPSYTLESLQRQGARHQVATLWIQEGLPDFRPGISTGLIYGCECPHGWESAAAILNKGRDFWRVR